MNEWAKTLRILTWLTQYQLGFKSLTIVVRLAPDRKVYVCPIRIRSPAHKARLDS